MERMLLGVSSHFCTALKLTKRDALPKGKSGNKREAACSVVHNVRQKTPELSTTFSLDVEDKDCKFKFNTIDSK